MKHFRALFISLAGLVLFAGVAVAATFDGSPPAPLSFTQGSFLDGWDVQVHSRNWDTWGGHLETMDAQHGADCGAPPATHLTTGSYTDSVFQCKDHVMTAIKAGGYGVVYLTPPEILDFSAGEAVIKFDVSTWRASGRDWWDVWVTPYGENLALPLQSWLPDLAGPPQDALHFNLGSEGNLCPERFTNFQGDPFSTEYGNACKWWVPASDVIATQSQTVRTTYEIHISQNHIKSGLPAQPSTGGVALWWFDQDVSNLNFSQGIVQIGHHSYTPEKDCNIANHPSPDGTCKANTWHWDNITLTPSIPFSITRLKREILDGESLMVPADGTLRFNAVCEIKIDGVVVNSQPEINGGSSINRPMDDNSYFLPISAGLHTFNMRNQSWYSGPCHVEDVSLWNNSGQPVPTVTPTVPPPTATATNTPLPTATATNTPIPPTATNTPRPTSTPVPVTYRCQKKVSGVWVTVWAKAGGGSCP